MLNLEQYLKIKQSVQSIAANGAHNIAKWTDQNGCVLFVYCNMFLKSDKTCRVTTTSWTAVSWIALASTPDQLQDLIGAMMYLTAL